MVPLLDGSPMTSAALTVDPRARYVDETPARGRFATAIEDLASRIEREWQRLNYDDDAFPELARRVLTEERMHERYSTRDVLREAVTAPLAFPQIDLQSKFGQPPVVYFRNARFYVAVLFWVDSTTSVHEHGFSGAFSVLGGSSLHASYRFTRRKAVNSRLSLGEIVRTGARILERGAVEEIVGGPRGAHALFHLERPSATLIVRTHSDPRARPQLAYHWPCYAIDPFFEDEAIGRKCQLLRLVHETDRDSLKGLAAGLLASLDIESAVRVLLFLRQLNLSVETGLELASVVARRHPELGEGLAQMVEEGHRQDRLVGLRQRVFDPERRLLLAFLLNRLSASEVNALVARKHPGGDPAELVAGWIVSLLRDAGGMQGSPQVGRAIRLLLATEDPGVASQRFAAELDAATDADREAAAALMRVLSDSPLLSTLLAAPARAAERGTP
jgi:hypothetical protein